MTLPLIDEHTVAVNAPAAAVFSATERYARSMAGHSGGWFRRALGARPASGFALSVDGSSLELTGSHRFSTYRLVFTMSPGSTVSPGSTGSVLSARSYAVFPGPHGRVYRALVISSGAHVVAVRRMLASITAAASKESC